jgi:hypothetical protein
VSSNRWQSIRRRPGGWIHTGHNHVSAVTPAGGYAFNTLSEV